MRLAIEQAKNMATAPPGAVIVDSRSRPTFHGEVNVINRLAVSPVRTEE